MKDMTQGKPLKLIIGFAIPMLIGNIFQQVYNVADTVIVGRFLGESALAGVGSTGTLTYFLLALVSGMCNGAGLVVAQCFGCGNKERLAKTVTALIWVAGVLTCIMSLIGIFPAAFKRAGKCYRLFRRISAYHLHLCIRQRGIQRLCGNPEQCGRFEDSAAGGDRFLCREYCV